jgi:hypothetical protein
MKKIKINNTKVTIYDGGMIRIEAKSRAEADIAARYIESEGFVGGSVDKLENFDTI